MILDSTLRKIQVVLAAAKATLDMSITVDYVDMTTTATIGGTYTSSSNGVTSVDILPAPAASTQRKVNRINIYNRDTAEKTISVSISDSGVLYPEVDVTLAVDDTLQYTDMNGWRVIDRTGSIKTATATSLTTSFTANIDGGNASSNYTSVVKVDGGGA